MGEKITELIIKIPTWLERPAVLPALLYRRLRSGYTFRRIRLTQGKYAIVDTDDYERLAKYKWYAIKHGRSIYAVRSVTIVKGRQKGIRMHREIIQAEEGKFCDHINHNGPDNRKQNLRPVNRAQNSWNKRKQKGKHSSKY